MKQYNDNYNQQQFQNNFDNQIRRDSIATNNNNYSFNNNINKIYTGSQSDRDNSQRLSLASYGSSFNNYNTNTGFEGVMSLHRFSASIQQQQAPEFNQDDSNDINDNNINQKPMTPPPNVSVTDLTKIGNPNESQDDITEPPNSGRYRVSNQGPLGAISDAIYNATHQQSQSQSQQQNLHTPIQLHQQQGQGFRDQVQICQDYSAVSCRSGDHTINHNSNVNQNGRSSGQNQNSISQPQSCQSMSQQSQQSQRLSFLKARPSRGINLLAEFGAIGPDSSFRSNQSRRYLEHLAANNNQCTLNQCNLSNAGSGRVSLVQTHSRQASSRKHSLNYAQNSPQYPGNITNQQNLTLPHMIEGSPTKDGNFRHCSYNNANNNQQQTQYNAKLQAQGDAIDGDSGVICDTSDELYKQDSSKQKKNKKFQENPVNYKSTRSISSFLEEKLFGTNTRNQYSIDKFNSDNNDYDSNVNSFTKSSTTTSAKSIAKWLVISSMASIYKSMALSIRYGWTIFDTFIVVCSFIDVIVLLSYPNETDNLGTIALFRMLRIMRVFRTVKLLRYCKSLWLLCHGLVAAFRTIAWIAVLLLILVYASAIFLTRLIGQDEDFIAQNPLIEDYYGNIGESMYTLFIILTLETWPERARPVIEVVGPGMCIFYVFYIILTHFTVLNLVVGVICEHIQSLSSTSDLDLMRRVREDRIRMQERLLDIFSELDEDKNGLLSKDELKNSLTQNAQVRHLLQKNNVDEEELTWLFEILDKDNSNSLTISEFVDGIMNLKSSEQARDLVSMQYSLVKELNSLQKISDEKIDKLEQEINEIRMKVVTQSQTVSVQEKLQQQTVSDQCHSDENLHHHDSDHSKTVTADISTKADSPSLQSNSESEQYLNKLNQIQNQNDNNMQVIDNATLEKRIAEGVRKALEELLGTESDSEQNLDIGSKMNDNDVILTNRKLNVQSSSSDRKFDKDNPESSNGTTNESGNAVTKQLQFDSQSKSQSQTPVPKDDSIMDLNVLKDNSLMNLIKDDSIMDMTETKHNKINSGPDNDPPYHSDSVVKRTTSPSVTIMD